MPEQLKALQKQCEAHKGRADDCGQLARAVLAALSRPAPDAAMVERLRYDLGNMTMRCRHLLQCLDADELTREDKLLVGTIRTNLEALGQPKPCPDAITLRHIIRNALYKRTPVEIDANVLRDAADEILEALGQHSERHPFAEGVEHYPLKAYIWKRTSVEPPEWVLEISGVINDCSFDSRHTEPLSTPPEDVAGLPSLYGQHSEGDVERDRQPDWPLVHAVRAGALNALRHADVSEDLFASVAAATYAPIRTFPSKQEPNQ